MRLRSLTLASLLAACGAGTAAPPAGRPDPMSATPPSGPAEAPPTGAPVLEPPPAARGFQVKPRSFTVAPGEEVYWCHRMPMPQDGAFDLRRVHSRFSRGAHHLLVSTVDERYDAGDGRCDAGTLGFGIGVVELATQNLRFLSGTQTPGQAAPEADTDFGEASGIGIHVKAGTTLLLQQHFVNATAEPIEAEALVNFWFAEAPLVKPLESFFFFHLDIDIPPHADKDVAARCTFPFATEVPAMNSHMHQHGIGFSAQRWKDGVFGEMLHQTTEWAEPKASAWPLDRMLQVARGDTLEYRCRYRNTTDERILVGESARDEMCMLVGYYVGTGGTLWGFPGSRLPGDPCVAVP